MVTVFDIVLDEKDKTTMKTRFIETLLPNEAGVAYNQGSSTDSILLLFDQKKANDCTFDSQRRCLFQCLNSLLLLSPNKNGATTATKAKTITSPQNEIKKIIEIIIFVFVDYEVCNDKESNVTAASSHMNASQYLYDVFEAFPVRIHPTIHVLLPSS